MSFKTVGLTSMEKTLSQQGNPNKKAFSFTTAPPRFSSSRRHLAQTVKAYSQSELGSGTRELTTEEIQKCLKIFNRLSEIKAQLSSGALLVESEDAAEQIVNSFLILAQGRVLNCYNCAAAVDAFLRQKEGPSVALPSPSGECAETIYQHFDEAYGGSMTQSYSDASEMAAQMKNMGAESRGIVIASQGSVKHAFNVVNINNGENIEAYYVDGQKGQMGKLSEWRPAYETFTLIMPKN